MRGIFLTIITEVHICVLVLYAMIEKKKYWRYGPFFTFPDDAIFIIINFIILRGFTSFLNERASVYCKFDGYPKILRERNVFVKLNT